jgi:hypothetical protein
MECAKRQLFPCYKWLACCLVLWFCPLCFGQMITIRVINQKDGQPLQKAQVSLSLLYEQGAKTPAHYESVLRAETDTYGKAEFSLPEPSPTHIFVQVKLNSGYWRCACAALVMTQDVLNKGMTVDPTHDAKPDKAQQARAGEIFFYAQPLTFFERLLYPFVKQ